MDEITEVITMQFRGREYRLTFRCRSYGQSVACEVRDGDDWHEFAGLGLVEAEEKFTRGFRAALQHAYEHGTDE